MNITQGLPDITKNLTTFLAGMISRPAPPPPGGWLDDLPEAFAALDERGEVFVIGYKGEWYEPIRLSPSVRLHNWLIRIGEHRPDDHG